MKKNIVLVSLLLAVSVFALGCGTDKNAAAAGDGQANAEVQADSGIAKFVGDWYVDGSLENGHLSIGADGHVESYSYDGMVNYEGELRQEEYENPDGSVGYLYNIYDGDEFVIGFYEPEEEDFYELYSGQDGEIHYVRADHCK